MDIDSAEEPSGANSNQMTLDDETYADVLHLATKGENPRHQAPRAVIWDAKAGVKLPTADSPPLNELPAFLAAHPHCEVFNGQQPPLKRLASDDDDILPLKKKIVKAVAFKLVWEEMNPQLDEAAADDEEDEEDEGDEDEAVLSSLREENPQAFLEWSCR